MQDSLKLLKPWIVFGGTTLIISVLYWAQALLVPIAVALLLSFLLAPSTTLLQRWLGRIPAVLLVGMLAFSLLGLAVWGTAHQLGSLAHKLPDYRVNISQKIADVRGASKGGAVEKVQETIEEIRSEIAQDKLQRGSPARPEIMPLGRVTNTGTGDGFFSWLGPLLAPLANAAVIIVLVIFMLLERRQLRDRIIHLFGQGRLAVTTRAFDEATTRVSRYLIMQSLINLAYGMGVAVGLYLIGVPYWLLWACLAAVLRFIPYVGPWIAAGAPILVSLAALPGWIHPLEVLGLFVVLELLTNLVLEPFLYAGAAGVSQVALLLAVAFWTWLWGPLGLLLATPLTVCFVVLGKHVPGLHSIATFMADEPALDPQLAYYQRLLARDPSEALDLIERHIKTEAPESIYDEMLLPALNYAERDRIEGRLSTQEETALVQTSTELLVDAVALVHKTLQRSHPDEKPPSPQRLAILGCAAHGQSDDLALRMLEPLLHETPVQLDIAASGMLLSEMVQLIRQKGYSIICIADLPPSAPLRTRYLVKKLSKILPDLKIVVGRWSPSEMTDDSFAPLLTAGANHVTSSLLETRRQLSVLAKAVRPPEVHLSALPLQTAAVEAGESLEGASPSAGKGGRVLNLDP